MTMRARIAKKILFSVVALAACSAAAYGLVRFNAKMTIRYQGVGRVLDSVTNQPLRDVEVLLLVSPPPSAPSDLDALFRTDARRWGRLGPNGTLRADVGTPPVGLSGANGAYLARCTGRYSARQAIRFGRDDHRPPFETAWAVFRLPGYRTETMTFSILGWKTSGKTWTESVNRIPDVRLSPQ